MVEKDYILVDTKEARSLLFSKFLSVDIPSLSLAMVIAMIMTNFQTVTNFSIVFICIVIFGAYLTFFIVSFIDRNSEAISFIGKMYKAKKTISSDIFLDEEKIRIVNYNLISMFHIESLFYLIIYYSAYRGQSEEFKQKQMEEEKYEIDIEEVQELDIEYNLLFYDIVKINFKGGDYYLMLKNGDDFINKITLLQI